MSTFNQAAIEALWRGYDEASDFPAKRPLLAHYTTVGVLEKIVLSEELWLSNPLYMNDWEELRFGMNAGASEFRTNAVLREACGSPKAHSLLLESFDEFFGSFDRDHALDTYVLCLSEHQPEDNDGLLSMWRGYGANGNGVALVFDSTQINVREGSPFIFGKVKYASQPARLAWVTDKVGELAEVVRAHDKSLDNMRAAAWYWIERLKLFALFTKHDGFAEEREWRVVYFSQKDQKRLLAPMLGYLLSQRGVEPKLKLKLGALPKELSSPMSLETVVERIVLGPSLSNVLASNSVRRMLELSGRKALASRVIASSIPFRP